MATRKLTRKAADLTQEDRIDDTEKTSKNAQGPPFKKRKVSNETPGGQPTRSKTKGKKGMFANDVPFDVLLEIFRLLEPVDLFHLSRVSKSLHASLTSNEMTPLWQSAYENVPWREQPPPCPDNTNIMFYTNFLYGRHCQFCASIYGRIYHESAFIRLCLKCANKSFLGSDRGDPVCELCNLWTLPKCRTQKVPDWGILKEEHSLRLKEFKKALKEKTVKRYVEVQKMAVQNRLLVASRLSSWRLKMQNNQIERLKAIRDKREADMKNKLEEEGFKADSDRIGEYNWASRVPHAQKPHPLTDSEWSFIRADILDFFQDIREKEVIAGVKRELRDLISKLKQFILQWEIRPAAWWIASSEPIASFMKSESEETSKKDFNGVEVEIRNLIASWREEMDRYLAAFIPLPSRKGKKKVLNSDTTVLKLATTFFKCDWCTEPIGYPRVLMHACLRKDDEKTKRDNTEDDEEDAVDNPRTRARGPRQPRPPIKIGLSTVLPMLSDEYNLEMFPGRSGVTFNKEASNSARDIITVCGEDPNTVTYAEMEESTTRLECLRCSQAMQEKPRVKSARLVMRWNMAVLHELEEHHGEAPSSEPAWRKIDSEEDLSKIEEEESYMKMLPKHQDQQLSCIHCSSSRYYATSLQEQICHIKWQHNKSDVDAATVSQHFRPSMDVSIKNLYPVVTI